MKPALARAASRNWRRQGAALCLVLALSGIAAADELANREKERQALRSEIETVQTRLSATSQDITEIMAELQRHEAAALRANKTLEEIDAEVAAKGENLTRLQGRLAALEEKLQAEAALLAEQARALHRSGRGDYIKLLLNQEDPARVGRILAYHDYYSQARARRINAVTAAMERLTALRNAIGGETEKLQALRAEQEAKLREFNTHRHQRGETLVRLQSVADQQGRKLKTLLKTEQELAALIDELKEQRSIVKEFEKAPPFNSLRGTLSWPVRGRITQGYGRIKKGGKLRSQGVTFRAKAGAEVRAVSAGQVIYADWFKHLGLLLIVDHGDGFMSLYGHNSSLLKKPGDWVEKDKPIAKAGDTGGQQNPGLYFEIRRRGTPLNPARWCKR